MTARDAASAQPSGRLLVGGHSYGGVVAAVAAVRLEALGRAAAATLLIDAPPPDRVRRVEAEDAEAVARGSATATGDEVIEFMELVLGAMGRDAVGVGAGWGGSDSKNSDNDASNADHPAHAPVWRNTCLRGKIRLFAPIWRVMRGDASLTEANVVAQLAAVAAAVRTGSQPSDLRRLLVGHPDMGGDVGGCGQGAARARMAPYVFVRGAKPGACSYVDDGGDYGLGWEAVADQVSVIDVPGDHFSLLRQTPSDALVLSRVLRCALGSKTAWGGTGTASTGGGGAKLRTEAGDLLRAAGAGEAADRLGLGSTEAEAEGSTKPVARTPVVELAPPGLPGKRRLVVVGTRAEATGPMREVWRSAGRCVELLLSPPSLTRDQALAAPGAALVETWADFLSSSDDGLEPSIAGVGASGGVLALAIARALEVRGRPVGAVLVLPSITAEAVSELRGAPSSFADAWAAATVLSVISTRETPSFDPAAVLSSLDGAKEDDDPLTPATAAAMSVQGAFGSAAAARRALRPALREAAELEIAAESSLDAGVPLSASITFVAMRPAWGVGGADAPLRSAPPFPGSLPVLDAVVELDSADGLAILLLRAESRTAVMTTAPAGAPTGWSSQWTMIVSPLVMDISPGWIAKVDAVTVPSLLQPSAGTRVSPPFRWPSVIAPGSAPLGEARLLAHLGFAAVAPRPPADVEVAAAIDIVASVAGGVEISGPAVLIGIGSLGARRASLSAAALARRGRHVALVLVDGHPDDGFGGSSEAAAAAIHDAVSEHGRSDDGAPSAKVAGTDRATRVALSDVLPTRFGGRAPDGGLGLGRRLAPLGGADADTDGLGAVAAAAASRAVSDWNRLDAYSADIAGSVPSPGLVSTVVLVSALDSAGATLEARLANSLGLVVCRQRDWVTGEALRGPGKRALLAAALAEAVRLALSAASV